MKLIKQSGKAIGVANQWYNTYCVGNGVWRYGDDKRIIYEKLIALGDSPDPKDIDRIIGNNSWTSTRCDECGTYNAEDVLMLGEEPDYESATVHICWPCLSKAAIYMQEAYYVQP